MNHSEATQLQAAVKYVLGELSPAEHAAYEEHYFDCAECAADLKALAAFADNAREVLRQQQAEQLLAARVLTPSIWSRLFHPVIAVPAFAALLLIIVYQNTSGLPGKKPDGAQVFNSYSLMGPSRGVGDGVAIQIHPNETFALDFDLTTTKTFDHFLCQLQDEAGNTMVQVRLAGALANREVHLLVPGTFKHAGKYSLVVAGAAAANDSWAQATEISRMHFVVEFIP